MLAEKLQHIMKSGIAGKRSLLLHAVTDLFFVDSGTRSNVEQNLYSDVAMGIWSGLTPDERFNFSDRIADEALAPRLLVIFLSNEDFRVARPILERSLVMTDADLVMVAEQAKEEHRLAITCRRVLSEPVVSALLINGGDAVHQRIASHPNAPLTAETRKLLRARPAPPPMMNGFSPAVIAQEVMGRIRAGNSTLDDELKQLAPRGMTHVIGHLLASFTQVKSEVAVRTVVNGKTDALLMLLRAANASFESATQVLHMQARLLKHEPQDVEPLRKQFEETDRAKAQRIIRFVR